MTIDKFKKIADIHMIDDFATDLVSCAKLEFDDLDLEDKQKFMMMLSNLVSSPSVPDQTKYFMDDHIADRMTDFAKNIINDILDFVQERKRFSDKYPDNYDSHQGEI